MPVDDKKKWTWDNVPFGVRGFGAVHQLLLCHVPNHPETTEQAAKQAVTSWICMPICKIVFRFCGKEKE
jgi:hypothetical protein